LEELSQRNSKNSLDFAETPGKKTVFGTPLTDTTFDINEQVIWRNERMSSANPQAVDRQSFWALSVAY